VYLKELNLPSCMFRFAWLDVTDRRLTDLRFKVYMQAVCPQIMVL
jgi:hypothetical protein